MLCTLEDKTFYIVGKLYDGEFENKYIKPLEEKFIKSGFEVEEKNPSLVVSVGGDGTLLRAARKYPNSEILGIRAESKGGSLPVDYKDSDEAVEKILSDDYEIVELPKVELEYKNKKTTGLNEVYFFRDVSKFPGADRFRVYKDEVDLYSDEVYADGCMLVTPFGSSAYNRSYYGPIIEEGLILMPMAGCLLHKTEKVKGVEVAKHAKPVVIDDDEEILVEIKRDAPNVICGDNNIDDNILLKVGDEITFRKSDSYTKLIKLNNFNI